MATSPPPAQQAIWHPEAAPDLAYVELRLLPESFAFNVAPGE